MMDRPTDDVAILRDDLNNLRTINKYFGGLSSVQNAFLPLIERVDAAKSIEVLDLATGSADHPVALVKLARTRRRFIHITAVDKNPHMLAVARELTASYPEITVTPGDILSPGFPDKRFDIVLCSLAIHHFSREDAVTILRNMARISRVGFIVNDLSRSRLGAWTAWFYTHLTTRNPMTLYDSYVSVLRAFTPHELAQMAHEAGIRNFAINTRPFFRLILVGQYI